MKIFRAALVLINEQMQRKLFKISITNKNAKCYFCWVKWEVFLQMFAPMFPLDANIYVYCFMKKGQSATFWFGVLSSGRFEIDSFIIMKIEKVSSKNLGAWKYCYLRNNFILFNVFSCRTPSIRSCGLGSAKTSTLAWCNFSHFEGGLESV